MAGGRCLPSSGSLPCSACINYVKAFVMVITNTYQPSLTYQAYPSIWEKWVTYT